MSSLRDWKGYNEALVKSGTILLDLDFVADWSRELKAMNDRKEGARYRYPQSFMETPSGGTRLRAALPPTGRLHEGT
jgi:hypothetical protein